MIYDFNYFRAIAIFIIVFGHVVIFSDYGGDDFRDFIRNLFSGGTGLFVYVSGFMFHHVFLKNFSYMSFLKKKTVQLIPPYIFLSLLPVALSVVEPRPVSDGYYLPVGDSFFDYYILPFFKYVVTGGALVGYWYIPFAMVLFLISPIFILYCRINFLGMISLALMFLCFSSFVHRPEYNIPLWQSLIYYVPFYMLGIFSSKYRNEVTLSRKYALYVSFFMLFSMVLISYYMVFLEHVGNFTKYAFSYSGLDFQVFKVLFLCVFLYVGLIYLNPPKDRGVWKVVKDYSFPIFFLHGYALEVLSRLSLLDLLGTSFMGVLVLTVFCMLFSIFVTKSFEMLLGANSKYFVAK